MKISVIAGIEFEPESEGKGGIAKIELRLPANVEPDSFLMDWMRSTHFQMVLSAGGKCIHMCWHELSLVPHKLSPPP